MKLIEPSFVTYIVPLLLSKLLNAYNGINRKKRDDLT